MSKKRPEMANPPIAAAIDGLGLRGRRRTETHTRDIGQSEPKSQQNLTPEILAELEHWTMIRTLRQSEHWPAAPRGARRVLDDHKAGRAFPVPPPGTGYDTPESHAEWLQWCRDIVSIAGRTH